MPEPKEKRRLTTPEVKKLSKDSTFYVLGVVSRFAQRRDKNDNPFWDIALMDGEGQIEGKIWGNSEWWHVGSDVKYKMDPISDELLKKLGGRTVGLQGKVVEFREQNQYNFNAVYYVDQEKYPPHGFVRRSPIPAEKMEGSFRELLDICGEAMKGFLEYLFFQRGLWQTYNVWPAAVSLHHAYVGGLLEHSLAVTRSAAGIAQNYRDYGVDMDVVIASALLHDIGKLESYRLSPAPEMTLGGNVVDHIVLGYHRFMTLAREYDEEHASNKLGERRTLAIGHILVSHHGAKEFGSPVLPATPEALIVSAADELDFKLFCWKEQTSQLEGEKEVTEFVPSVQRRFWKGHAAEEERATPS
ncbi:MAG: HD domain-containing protein [Synergistaceae bacterium]|jgi:3'-5' exoribonuclease|nr:HD domain-containing protein [Synergistaceae bacterium]